MRKITLLIFILILALNLTYSQKTKKIKNRDPRTNAFESYEVLKENPEQRNGEYIYKFQGEIQVKGRYVNNQVDGEWIYTPGSDFKIIAKYKQDKKHGEWRYYKGDILISILNYENDVRQGKCTGYFESGKIASEEFYEKGKLVHQRKSYYENGKVKELSDYKNGKLDGLKEIFDEQGNLLYRIVFREDVPYDLEIVQKDAYLLIDGDLKNGTGQLVNYALNYNTNEILVKSKRNYKEGLLHGEIEGYDYKGELFYRGQYLNGYMVGMWSFYLNDEDKRFNQVYHITDSLVTDTTKWFLDDSENYFDPDLKLPLFKNETSDRFRYHIMRNLQYPMYAQEHGISGKVMVRFKIDTLGLIRDLEIITSVHELLDNEALRVVQSSPLWIPGFKDQIPVGVQFTFPIVFTLR